MTIFRCFCLVLMTILVISCEKPAWEEAGSSTGSTMEQDANLVLRVSTLTRADNDTQLWGTLMFEIYQNDKKVKDIVQKAGTDNFGTVGVKLAPGTYQLLIMAHNCQANPSRPRPTEIEFSNKTGYSDVFYYYGDVNVSESRAHHDITLHRATSLIRFVTKDNLPSQVKSLVFNYEGGSATLNAVDGFGYRASRQTYAFDVDDSMVGKPLQVDLYTFKRANSDEISLTVTANTTPRNASNIVKYRSLTCKVPLQYREISVITGYLFSDAPDGDDDASADEQSDDDESDDQQNTSDVNTNFSILIDSAWAGIHYYYF